PGVRCRGRPARARRRPVLARPDHRRTTSRTHLAAQAAPPRRGTCPPTRQCTPARRGAHPMKHSRPVRTLLAVPAACTVGLVMVPAPAQATSYVPVSGAGSTWSEVAIDAWRADVRASGVVVNYIGSGSTDGRSQYIQGTVDFADSEIPFENPPEPGQQ